MPLTELEAKYAKRRDRSYKLADGGGLFLLVQPNGSKLWRMKYRYDGKEKLLSFGAYPTLGIAAAREKRDTAKALLAEGKDPGSTRVIEVGEGDAQTVTIGADDSLDEALETMKRFQVRRLPVIDGQKLVACILGLYEQASVRG